MSPARRLAALPCGRKMKWAVLVFWIVMIGVLGGLAGKLNGAEKNDASSWLPGSAESTKALNLKTDHFQKDQSLPAIVVYERKSGITPDDLAKAASDKAAASNVKHVDAGKIIGPVPSKDGKAIQMIVPIVAGKTGWEAVGKAVDQVRDIAKKNTNGMSMHIAGPGGSAADSAKAFKGIDGILLFATLGVVILMLLITYRSPILWALPVISAGTALMISQGVIYLLAKHAGLTVNAQSAGILTVLVFGAGTDYALLLVARYREELRRHEDRHEAMAYALHRAAPALVASASTVVAGMLCLLVAEMNSTKSLGPVLAIGIGVGMFAMITLLPALLVIVGRWIFWPVRPHFNSPEPTERGMWAGVGRRIAVRPRVVWIVTALVLGGLALGLTDLKATGLRDADQFTKKVDSVTGAAVLAQHYPAGTGLPIEVIGKADKADELKDALANTKGIVSSSVTQPLGQKDGLVYLEGTLTSAPDSSTAKHTVDLVRANVHRVEGADAKAGGSTAINLDVGRAASHDNKLIIPIVLIVLLLILSLLLRALLAPVILVATVVISFAAALGVSALMFHHVFNWAGEDTSFPLFVFVFLVALGIDYNIFLMTRVREETLKHGTRRGALVGLSATGGVITSAGMVLAGTFAVLATLPLVGFAEIGFAVAFGVLLDTIVVRSVLVTALNLDIGRRIWWPGKLMAKRDEPIDAPAAEDEQAAVTVS
jgi:RND superfamily putative drug exporter